MKSINEIVEKIKETNEVFEAATPEQKRVMIAEDVIDWVLTKRLRPMKGHIITFGTTVYDEGVDDRTAKTYEKERFLTNVPKENSLQQLLFGQDAVNCEVCAKGALFMGLIGKVNEFKVGEVERNVHHTSNEMTKLRHYFTETQLSYIEYAFEGEQYVDIDVDGNRIKFSPDDHQKAVDFYDSFSNSEDCLLAIMQNIIHNNGEFVL